MTTKPEMLDAGALLEGPACKLVAASDRLAREHALLTAQLAERDASIAALKREVEQLRAVIERIEVRCFRMPDDNWSHYILTIIASQSGETNDG